MSSHTSFHHHKNHGGNAEKSSNVIGIIPSAVPEVSNEDRSHLIQIRAYTLWQRAGKPIGADASLHFCCDAEKEIAFSHPIGK